MAVLATYPERSDARPESDRPCRVATFYEDAPTRGRLLHLCDLLIKDLGPDIDFEFSWWKLHFLTDPVIACLCAQAAAQADMLVFSIYATREPTAHLKAVNEMWLSQREQSEGLLLILIDAVNISSGMESPALLYFQELAQRGQLELITHWFPAMPGSTGESMEYITRRANQVTPVLKEILDRSLFP